jgi:agmatine deiminase
MSWTMPHEGERHDRLWLAWPTQGYTLGDTPEDAQVARETWAAVANAAAGFEPVSVVVHPRDVEIAARFLDTEIELRVREIDDAWIRDSGPTFVRDEAGRLGAVTWVFNGWGRQEWASWEHDSTLAPDVAAWTGATRIDSSLVNEGGGIHVDGEGTVLITETVQLDPGRNPEWTRQQVERELGAYLGARKVIWLPRGLTRDYGEFGTRGHVDIVAAFVGPGVVVVHTQPDPAHPDHEVGRANVELLRAQTDAKGRALEVVELPAPTILTEADGEPVDYSYVNHYLGNGFVLLCAFDDPRDQQAAEILGRLLPDRKVELVDARPIFERGGGIHCITQQQPAV